MENGMEIPQKIKDKTIYDPAILLLGIHLKNTKTLIRKDKCTFMFIAMKCEQLK